MYVKPVEPNAIIRDPITKQPLPAEGGPVSDNVFWNRRLISNPPCVRLMTPAEVDALLAKQAKAEADAAKATVDDAREVQPAGAEPVAPLTTRTGAKK